MPFILKDLVVDRVDLVDEGANSAAFIELYKRKETDDSMEVNEILSLLKSEHAEVVKQALAEKDDALAKAAEALTEKDEALAKAQSDLAEKDAELTTANEALANASAELEKSKNCDCDGEADENGVCKSCGKPKKKSASFDETQTLKSMPAEARELFLKMRAQKEAAEEQVRKNAEEKAEAEAVAKAASLKAIPVEQEKLVGIIKSATPEIVDLLTSINSAIESTVLDEVGKAKGNGADTGSADAWAQLEQKASEIAKRDSVTIEKAMSTALDEYPDLYREYLNGGAK